MTSNFSFKQNFKYLIALLFCVSTSLFCTETKAQTQLYVDSSIVTSGNGSSWSSAYQRLTSALNVANSGSGNYVIHVAQGTYLPTSVNGVTATSRDSSFTIFRKGISILGGYSSGGVTRNSKQYVTRISGNIGTSGSTADNLYHVLILAINSNSTDSLIIDGVNIEGGNANGSSSAVINGVTFEQSTGAGVYIRNNNSATIDKVFLNNCLVQNNAANVDGGGMENYKCTLGIIGSCFYNNSCINYGAGLNNEAGGSLILINDVFTNNVNSSGFGGGLRVSGSSTNQIINCTFTNNSAPTGGAIRVASLGTATVKIHNSIFRGNHSSTDYTSTNADVSNGATLVIDTSCLQSSQTCAGCLAANTDPSFTNISNPLGSDGFFGTADDGITLSASSPCVNIGNDGIFNVYGYTTDIVGSDRFQGSHIDFGAYERGPISSIVTNGSFGTVYLCSGTPGNYNSFNISGTALTNNITITAPTGFELSTSSNSGYSSSPIVLTQTSGNVAQTTIYIQVASNAVGTFSGTINATSSGAITQSLPITAIVDATSASAYSVTNNGNYTWSINSQTYTQSGTYVSVSGCHSDTLHLTISNGTIDTVTVASCSNYTWSANNQTYTTSGYYSYTPAPYTTHVLDLTINALPTVTATANTAVCAGTSVSLSGSGANSYSWNYGISNGVSFTPNATTTYTVTGTDGNGCSNTAQTTVTVNPLPTVNAGADQTICPGTSATLTATGAISYSWTGSVTNGTAFSPAATATYVVTGTDANNCSNSDTAIVTVKTFVIASTTPKICKGLPDTLTAPIGTNYVWRKNGGILKGKTTQQLVVKVVGSYTVTLTDAQCGVKTTAPIVLTLQTPPAQPVIAATSTLVCPGASTTISITQGAAIYLWFIGNKTTSVSGVSGNSFSTTTTGTYYVRVVDSFGCYSKFSNPKVINQAAAPAPQYIITNGTQGSKKLACKNNGTYQWRLNGNNINGATGKVYIATQSGTYSVSLVNAAGCTAVSADTTLTIIYTGPKMSQEEMNVLNNEAATSSIVIYPNPSTGIFYVEGQEKLSAIVSDIQGRIITEIEEAKTIDLSQYQSGVYLLQLFNEQHELVKTTKLVKE